MRILIVEDERSLREALVDLLTGREFAVRTMTYWMLETGAGLTVVLTAVLGLVVSAVVTSQTLYTVTQEHLVNYATLSAVGFGRGKSRSTRRPCRRQRTDSTGSSTGGWSPARSMRSALSTGT